MSFGLRNPVHGATQHALVSLGRPACGRAMLRAWVRRGFMSPLGTQGLTSGHELDWFVLTLAGLGSAPWSGVIGAASGSGKRRSRWRSRQTSRARRLFIRENSETRPKEAVGSWIAAHDVGSKTRLQRLPWSGARGVGRVSWSEDPEGKVSLHCGQTWQALSAFAAQRLLRPCVLLQQWRRC